jgi:hypothetical protein
MYPYLPLVQVLMVVLGAQVEVVADHPVPALVVRTAT